MTPIMQAMSDFRSGDIDEGFTIPSRFNETEKQEYTNEIFRLTDIELERGMAELLGGV